MIRLGRVDAPTLLYSFRSNTDEAELGLRTSAFCFKVVLFAKLNIICNEIYNEAPVFHSLFPLLVIISALEYQSNDGDHLAPHLT